MRILISKDLVLQVFCYSREAERSVDRALCARWSELRAYYTEDKRTALTQLIAQLSKKLPPPCSTSPPQIRNDVFRSLSSPGLLRYLFGKWVGPWKKAWWFAGHEIAFMASTLTTILGFLESTHRPTNDALIALRMDLHACEYLIECRCLGLPELARAQRIEHLHGPRHIRLFKLEEILGRPNRAGEQTGTTYEHR